MSSSDWSYTGRHLPWLRGQGVHFARAGLESSVASTLGENGFAVAAASSIGVTSEARFASVATALRLPESCGNNLDALADSLGDLALSWPGAERLVLLWSSPDELMHVDLLAFHQLCVVLGDATDALWADDHFLFETIAFVPPPFGADEP